jgi:8-oxo-dGTP pyrophosphatase MutT (NUDIX family)
MARLWRLLSLLPAWASIAWWGILSSRRDSAPREVFQAAILGDEGVLLTLRPDLQGWELPGGAAFPGESGEAAVRREVREETGLDVEVESLVGDYHRTGFGVHRARVYRCRVRGGALRTSVETPAVAWFDPVALPRTLFPWYRGPLADALANLPEPVERYERQGWRAIAAGMGIDLVTRWRGVEAVTPRPSSPRP